MKPRVLCANRVVLMLAFAVAALVGPHVIEAAPGCYTLRMLEPLSGDGAFSTATGINDAGQIVGQAVAPDGLGHAVLWDRDGVHDLGASGGGASIARAINQSGQAIGVGGVDTAPQATKRPYLFIFRDGAMINLGSVDRYTIPTAMNAAGEFVGFFKGPRGARPALWRNSVLNDLGSSFQGNESGSAWGINDAGRIVGDVGALPAMWVDGAPHLLKLPQGVESGKARAINNLGQIAGAVMNGTEHAVLWESDGSVHFLDRRRTYSSEAAALNNVGQIVGYVQEAGANTAYGRIVVWDGDSDHDLAAEACGGLGGWILQRAVAINNAGAIVGQATRVGGPDRAFLLTPPTSSQAPVVSTTPTAVPAAQSPPVIATPTQIPDPPAAPAESPPPANDPNSAAPDVSPPDGVPDDTSAP